MIEKEEFIPLIVDKLPSLARFALPTTRKKAPYRSKAAEAILYSLICNLYSSISKKSG